LTCLILDYFKSILNRRHKGIEISASGLAPEDAKRVTSCESKINYIFQDKNLIIEALKHRSYLAVSNEPRFKSNERLEFLGDAILDMITTEYLFRQYPTYSEGNLSKMKSTLVSRNVLARVGHDLDLGNSLLLNHGEEKTGGRTRDSLLSNTFESVLGAIYLDSDFETAEKFVNRVLLKNSEKYYSEDSLQNFKSILLEYSQGKGWGAPDYFLIEEEGPDHDKNFTIGVKVNGDMVGTGFGKSKKIAEQKAAHDALGTMKVEFE